MNRHSRRKKRPQQSVNLQLYQFNKQILSQSPPYSNTQLLKLKEELTTWDSVNNCYYMLLNNEKRYYTVLHHIVGENEFKTLGDSVITLLQELGYEIISHEYTDEHYEIWVKNDIETLVYMLFSYDKGVVNYG